MKSLGEKFRAREISSYHKKNNDLDEFARGFPDVDYRYVFWESNGIGNLDFNNSTTWPLQEMGRSDAKAALEEGPGAGMLRLQDWVKESRGL